MFELIYTSAPRGLLPGHSGFSTVAVTCGLPPNLITPLENLSGYNFIFQDGKIPPQWNPACCSYVKMRYGNQMLSVISRIAPNGLDYSQRNNKIAHHILLESPRELDKYPAGAAELFLANGFFVEKFDRDPMELPFRQLPDISTPFSGNTQYWQKLAGYQAWAGIIAEKFRSNPAKPMYILYPDSISVEILLQLVMEICILLTPTERADFTFTTAFRNDNTTGCFLRFTADYSPYAGSLQQIYGDSMLKLACNNPLPANYTPMPVQQPAAASAVLNTHENNQDTVDIAVRLANLPGIEYSQLPSQDNSPCVSSPDQPLTTHYRRPEEQRNQDCRRLLFLAISGIIILLGACSILYFMIPESTTENPGTEFANLSRQLLEPQNLADAAENSPNIVSTTDITICTSTAANKVTADDPSAVSKDYSPESLQLDQAVMLPGKIALTMFLSYRQLLKNQSSKMIWQLPEMLEKSQFIAIKLSQLGSQRHDLEKFIYRQGPLRISIVAAAAEKLPLQLCSSDLRTAPQLLLEYDKANNCLQMQSAAATFSCIMPEPKKIMAFYFVSASGQLYFWPTAFDKRYVQYIDPGKITVTSNGVIKYTPSAAEKDLAGYIQSWIGSNNSLNSLSLFLDNWNQAAEDFLNQQRLYQDLYSKLHDYKFNRVPLPTLEEVKRICDALENEAEAINHQLDGNIDNSLQELSDKFCKFLQNLYSVNTNIRHYQAIYNVLSELPAELSEELQNDLKEKVTQETRRQQIRTSVEQYQTLWHNELDKLQMFINLLQKFNRQEKAFKSSRNELQIKLKITLEAAGKIDHATSRMLKNLLLQPDKAQQRIMPRILADQDIQKINNFLKEKVRITTVEESQE